MARKLKALPTFQSDYTANYVDADRELHVAMGGLIQAWRKDPVKFAVEALGQKPWKAQRAILEAMGKSGAKVTAKSGHGTGKSFTLAILIWHQLVCWNDAKVVCTAPTSHQLFDVLWSEVAKLHKKLPPSLADKFKINNDEVYCVEAKQTWKAVARTARADQPEGLQGFHQAEPDRLLVVVEEGSGVPDAIYEVLEGALTHTHARAIIMGNPTRRDGYFFDTHTRYRDIWKCFTLRSLDAPARLVDPGYAPRIAKRYGINSNVYRVRVLGEFPRSEPDTVVPIEWVEAAMARDLPKSWFKSCEFQAVLQLDVAKFGGDDSVLTVKQGVATLGMFQWHGNDEAASAEKVIFMAKKLYAASAEYRDGRLYRPAYFPAVLVDYLGPGVKVCQILRETPVAIDDDGSEVFLTVIPVNVGLDAKSQHVMRVRDRLWWKSRLFFQDQHAMFAPPPPEGSEHLAELMNWNPNRPFISAEVRERVANELSTPKYKLMDGGKIKIEGKDEMRKRLNINEEDPWSPDAADSFNLGFHLSPTPKGEVVATSSWDRSGEASTDLMGA